MFWDTNKNKSGFEPHQKFKFIALVDTFINDDPTKSLNVLGSDPVEFFKVLVKKIDAPKMNIDFERAYANEHIHYFQNGPINWEPINITFADVTQSDSYVQFRSAFLDYIKFMGRWTPNNTQVLEQNRTTVIDLPTLCESITIISLARFATSEYPYINKGKILQQESTEKNQRDKIGFIEQKLTDRKASTNVADKFIIKRPRLTKIDFGNFDYNSDEINEINITVVPEWCSFESYINDTTIEIG